MEHQEGHSRARARACATWHEALTQERKGELPPVIVVATPENCDLCGILLGRDGQTAAAEVDEMLPGLEHTPPGATRCNECVTLYGVGDALAVLEPFGITSPHETPSDPDGEDFLSEEGEMDWKNMTTGEAEALAIGLAEAAQERRVAGAAVGGPVPDEWEPAGHEPSMSRYTQRHDHMAWLVGGGDDDETRDFAQVARSLEMAQ